MSVGIEEGCKRTCVVTGVGEGTGAALVRRFAAGGYRVAMLARNAARLRTLEAELPEALAFPTDLADLEQIDRVCEAIGEQMDAPHVLIHNAVRASFRNFLEGDPHDLERNFRVNTTALLWLARAFGPRMIERGFGSIAVTGNTAAFRGVPDYALFSPTKAAQRNLSQALARELGPKRIHVSYFNIDGVIDVPWTREPLDPATPDEFFVRPEDIAEEVYRVVHQPPSAWAFDVEMRPFGERW